MSTQYTAYTVIGVRLHQGQLDRYRELRSCSCYVDNTTTKFCPQCGAKMWKQHKYQILTAKDGDGNLTANIKMIEPFHEAGAWFLGMVLSSEWHPQHGYCCNFVHMPPDKLIRDVIADLKKLLEPHKLWDESDFGIYTFVGIS